MSFNFANTEDPDQLASQKPAVQDLQFLCNLFREYRYILILYTTLCLRLRLVNSKLYTILHQLCLVMQKN